MRRSGKFWSILTLLCTLLSFASSLHILADVLGDAAWNGLNFALSMYLFLSAAGTLGLLLGVFTVFSRKTIFAWITCISAATVAGLSILFGLSFIFGRDTEVPLNSPVYYGHLVIPILALYGIVAVCCSAEAILFFPRNS